MTDQNAIIDKLIDVMKLKNDAALSRALSYPPPVVSKIRHNRLPIGPSFILRAHLVSGMDAKSLMELAGFKHPFHELLK